MINSFLNKNPQNINIEIFTDRETCLGCNTLIRRINSPEGYERTKNLFKIKTDIDQGIYHTLNEDGRRLTEKINKDQEDNYYSKLDLNSVK